MTPPKAIIGWFEKERCHGNPKCGCVPVQGDWDGRALSSQLQSTVADESPLDDGGGQQEVEADCAEPVLPEKRHQEPEPDEDHHVNILKHWRNTGVSETMMLQSNACISCFAMLL